MRQIDVLKCSRNSAHSLFSPRGESRHGCMKDFAFRTYQRVVAAEGERQLTLLRVVAHDLRDGLAYARDEARVLELANGRVVLGPNVLELMVAVKLDLPSELCELLRKSSLDEVDGAFVYAELGLRARM